MPAVEEAFSNPLAPPGESDGERPQRLTNADFRKLLMSARSTVASQKEPVPAAATTATSKTETAKVKKEKVEMRNSERKQRKSFYAKIKKEEEEKMAELAEKYRDRAKERREGRNPDYQAEDPTQSGVGAYRAVAPDVKSGIDAAERRKQMIQESKFLGGDMEHTHLVKGLDYALLQKVRSEIQLKESEVEPEIPVAEEEVKEKKAQEEDELAIKTPLGRRIINTVYSKQPDFNDMFLPGRMAYAVDLDDDAEDDIPTTVIRSKADLQGIDVETGRANKKQKKKEKGAADNEGNVDESIYPDIGDYEPSLSKSEKDKERDREHEKDRRDRDKDKERDRSHKHKDKEHKLHSYFGRSIHESVHEEMKAAYDAPQIPWSGDVDLNSDKNAINAPDRQQARSSGDQPNLLVPNKPQSKSKVMNRLMEEDYYTECYPGKAEMQDAIDDSDDEADYTKMDLGNKKGPVGRWDFDTQEEYSDYMNQREAMPKAAFQYGVKMADGRKTRRIGGNKEKDRNAELNREWQQIQQILKRRKESEVGG